MESDLAARAAPFYAAARNAIFSKLRAYLINYILFIIH